MFRDRCVYTCRVSWVICSECLYSDPVPIVRLLTACFIHIRSLAVFLFKFVTHPHRCSSFNLRWHFMLDFFLGLFKAVCFKECCSNIHPSRAAPVLANRGNLWNEPTDAWDFIIYSQLSTSCSACLPPPPPWGEQGMLRISLVLVESSMGHCWLHFLVFLRGRRCHKDCFSSSFHPLEKVNFSRDERTLGWLGWFSQTLLVRGGRFDKSLCEISSSEELAIKTLQSLISVQTPRREEREKQLFTETLLFLTSHMATV